MTRSDDEEGGILRKNPASTRAPWLTTPGQCRPRSTEAIRWLARLHAKPNRADLAAAGDSSKKPPPPPFGVARYPWMLPSASNARPMISPRELMEQAENRYNGESGVNEFKSTVAPPSGRINARGAAVGTARRDPGGKDMPPTSPRSLIERPMLSRSPCTVPTSWISVSGLSLAHHPEPTGRRL